MSEVQIGDKVLVTIESLGLEDEVMEVVSLGDPNYIEFVGEHIIVQDKEGRSQIVNHSNYKVIRDNDITIGNLVIPKYKKESLQQRVFYPVINKDDDGVKVIDDNGNKETYEWSEIEKAKREDVLLYINELQAQVNELQSVFSQLSKLIVDDIKHSLDKFNK